MKVIVSTLGFAEFLYNCFEADLNKFKTNPETKEIIMYSDKKEEIFPIELCRWDQAHREIDMEPHPMKIYNLFTFLKKLPEQPIVIEFEDLDTWFLKITLTEFTYRI